MQSDKRINLGCKRGKDEVKWPLFGAHMIVYYQNLRESVMKLMQTIRQLVR